MTIRTFTGKQFSPINPRIEDICIEDIAHSLSMTPRATGHYHTDWTIAHHSILVSYLCRPKNALDGLLHDGSEAYLIDMPTPIKYRPEMDWYRLLEKSNQKAINEAFGIMPHGHDVKFADRVSISWEFKTFFNDFPDDPLGFLPYGFCANLVNQVAWEHPSLFTSYDKNIVKNMFLDRFDEIQNKGKTLSVATI